MQRREIADGALLIEDNAVVWVGPTADLPPGTVEAADRVLDATGKIVLPGFVNTHHHFYQTLTRVVPGAQDAVLFDWLKTLYPDLGRAYAGRRVCQHTVGIDRTAAFGLHDKQRSSLFVAKWCSFG